MRLPGHCGTIWAMLRRFAVFHRVSGPDLQAWLGDRPGFSLWQSGVVAVAVWGGWHHSADGKGQGTLCGALCADHSLSERLQIRGTPRDLCDHRALMIEWLSAFGPTGLQSLTWQGTLCVIHLAQNRVLVARDPLGVGDVQVQALGGGWVITSDPMLSQPIDTKTDSPLLLSLPAGTILGLTPAGVAVQALRLSPEASAYFREIPDDIRAMTRRQAAQALTLVVQKASQSLSRGTSGLQMPQPINALQQWLHGQFPRHDRGGGWVSPIGLPTLVGELSDITTQSDMPNTVSTLPWPVPALEPPEPLHNLDPDELAQRQRRATTLIYQLLPAARVEAAKLGLTLVLPYLAPQVLALRGAWTPDQRPTSTDLVAQA